MQARDVIERICRDAGITLNGDKPFDLKVIEDRFYQKVMAQGSLGLGEAYMFRWWECDDLFGFFTRILPAKNAQSLRDVGLTAALTLLKARVLNVQTPRQTRRLADTHYNIGNHLFEHMLGPSMAYSCAYWADANDLDAAQTAKFDLICRKLKLHPGERLLDIGCGWGGLAKYAAEHYGVEVVGISVAREQIEYAQHYCAGLPISFFLGDYREFRPDAFGGPFDKIVSVGMVEHVGYRNYQTFMACVHEALKEGGLMLLHTIGSNESVQSTDAWIDKYIFHGGMLPSMAQLTSAAEGLLVLHDVHNIGVHYVKTLLAWDENFRRYWQQTPVEQRPKMMGSPDIFYRMWHYYLMICAADFAVGGNEVWQQVWAKGHLAHGYQREC